MSGKTGKSGRRSRRPLSADEDALWSSVIRSIAPLKRAPSPRDAAPAEVEPEDLATAPPGAPASPVRAARSEGKPREPALAPLDRRLKQRLARGRATIDARIDLHGLTQAAAHAALGRFLRAARAEGARHVLVITGKGASRGADPDGERGVLRRQVPLWLRSPELRDCVIGFEAAHVGHGGEGALYVRVRRSRRE